MRKIKLQTFCTNYLNFQFRFVPTLAHTLGADGEAMYKIKCIFIDACKYLENFHVVCRTRQLFNELMKNLNIFLCVAMFKRISVSINNNLCKQIGNAYIVINARYKFYSINMFKAGKVEFEYFYAVNYDLLD